MTRKLIIPFLALALTAGAQTPITNISQLPPATSIGPNDGLPGSTTFGGHPLSVLITATNLSRVLGKMMAISSFPLTNDADFGAQQATNVGGIIATGNVSAGSFDAGGGSGLAGDVLSWTNANDGAYGRITTNSHLIIVDQLGTIKAFTTNAFAITRTNVNSSFGETNGTFHMQNLALPAASYSGKLQSYDTNGVGAALNIGSGLTSDGLTLSVIGSGSDILFTFPVNTNGSEVAVYTNSTPASNTTTFLATWVVLGGPTNHSTGSFLDEYYRNGSNIVQHSLSNVVAQSTTGGVKSRWDTNAAGQIVLFATGKANEDVEGTVRGSVIMKNNGVVGGGGGGGLMYPTNLPGMTPVAWWNSDLSKFSGTPTAYWSDLYTNAYGFTNAGSFKPTKVANVIGTNSGINFNNALLTNTIVTTQPFTLCFTAITTNSVFVVGGTNAYVATAFGNDVVNGGNGQVNFALAPTNKYCTYCVTWNGTLTTVWTNGVLCSTHNVGSAGTTAFWMGSNPGGGGAAQMSFLDMALYSNVGNIATATNYNNAVTNALGVPLVQ